MEQELIALKQVDPAVLFAPGGLNTILQRIEQDARSIIQDITTAKGRDTIRSTAANISRSKTFLDGIGQEYVQKLKRLPGLIDAERRTMRDRLDTLRDEVRKPLTDYENAEKTRVDRHISALAEINDSRKGTDRLNAQELADRLERLPGMKRQGQWEEYEEDAAMAYAIAEAELKSALLKRQKEEKEAAEAAERKRQQEEEARRKREEQIAAEAVERGRQQAAAEAKRAIEHARMKQEQERLRLERELAMANAREAETRAKAAEAEATRMKANAQEPPKPTPEKPQAAQAPMKATTAPPAGTPILRQAHQMIRDILLNTKGQNPESTADLQAVNLLAAIIKGTIPGVTFTE